MGASVQPTTVLAPNWWLGVLDQKYWPLRKIPYFYEIDANPLANQAAPQQFSTDVQADSDFALLAISALVTTTATPPVLLWGSGFTNNAPSQVLCQVTDLAVSLNLQQALVPLDNIAGSGPFQAQAPWPYVFGAAGKIGVSLINQNNAAMVVRLTFCGVRIFTS